MTEKAATHKFQAAFGQPESDFPKCWCGAIASARIHQLPKGTKIKGTATPTKIG